MRDDKMKTEIIVISDNISGNGLAGEWGLCLLIKYNDKKILVDSGASDLFLENLKKSGERVEEIDYAVLSHAHYDHANGFPSFLKNNSTAGLYVRDSVEPDCYFKKFVFRKYIGIPRKMLDDNSDRVVRVSGNYELTKGIYLIPHKENNLSIIGKREMMYRRTPEGWCPDDFSHEQSVVVETEKGLLIINSCSHGGAANILTDVKSVFPEKRIYGYIGGLHLFNKSKKVIQDAANEFQKADLEYICTGHCTKNRAYNILKEKLGDKLTQFHVGLHIRIE